MAFAEKLKHLRERAGLTQSALADTTGLGLGTIRDYEQGKKEPTLRSTVKLAAALSATVEEFADSLDEKASEGQAAQKTRGRPRKATPATPAADDLEQEGKKRHGEGTRPRRSRKAK